MEEENVADAASFSIQVERRRGNKWVLRLGLGEGGNGRYLSVSGTWDFNFREEPALFPLNDALAKAEEWAPKIVLNGWTAQQCLAWHKAGCPRDGEMNPMVQNE